MLQGTAVRLMDKFHRPYLPCAPVNEQRMSFVIRFNTRIRPVATLDSQRGL